MRNLPVTSDPGMRDRLEQTFELFRFGVGSMRETLRRRHPNESPEEIDERLATWLLEPVEESVTSRP